MYAIRSYYGIIDGKLVISKIGALKIRMHRTIQGQVNVITSYSIHYTKLYEEKAVDEELRRKILEDYQRVMEADYFEALGILRQCGGPEVRRAYYKLAKEYHPDRFLGSGLSKEMSSKIGELFQYITHAYSVLSDPKSCSDYLDELLHGPKKSININQVIEAETA